MPVRFVPSTAAPTHPGRFRRPVTGDVTRLPVTYPTTPLVVRVELLLGGVWVDISEYVRYEPRIVIAYGRRNERSTSPPSTCQLTFRNDDKRFSPRNITGPYFGQLGRNTQLRVWVNPGSGDSLQFTGFVPDWTPRLELAEAHNTVRIQASGVTRRLGQGNSPVNSPLFNTISTDTSRVVRYWPCEDDEFAEVIASGLPGGQYANFANITLASTTSLFGSKPLPTFESGGSIDAPVAFVPTNGRWQVDFHYYMPALPAANTKVLEWHSTTGTVVRWDWTVNAAGTFALHGYDSGGTLVVNSAFTPGATNPIVGAWVHVLMFARQSGGNVDWEWKRFPSLGGDGSFANGSIAGTLGDLSRMVTPPDQAGVAGMSTGHWTVYDDYNYIQAGSPAAGYRGEAPTDRFTRLCAEAGIASVVDELVVDGETMGPQSTASLLTLLRECEAVNEGLIDETKAGELRLGSRTTRYLRQPDLILDFAGPQVASLQPTDDDFALRNDWTIARSGGSRARAVQETGPLNVQEPEDDPEGVGRYDDSATLNLEGDQQNAQHATWRLAAGTTDEPRFTTIRFALHRTPALIPAWLASGVNSRVLLLNPPDDIGADTVDQIVEGYTQTIDHIEWWVELTTSPTAAHTVVQWGGGSARYDCAGSTLSAALVAEESYTDGFESGVSGWTPTDATFVQSSAQAHAGTFSGLLTVVGTPSQAYVRYEWPVTAGQQYTASVWCYRTAGYADLSGAVDWYDAGHGYISTSSSGGSALAAATWEQRAVTATAPAGAVYAQFGPTLGSSPGAGVTLHVDDALFASALPLAISDNCVWAHDDGDYEIRVGKERMLVTAVGAVGGAYPAQTQTLTATRGYGGVALSHDVGVEVHVWPSARYAL